MAKERAFSQVVPVFGRYKERRRKIELGIVVELTRHGGSDAYLVSSTTIPSSIFDVFLCSAPKTGTTWLKALSFAIVSRTTVVDDGSTAANPFHSKLPQDPPISPSLLFRNPCPVVESSTFVETQRIPLFQVSLPGKTRNVEKHGTSPFDKAFELFCNGESFYGPYWDHVLGYWNASLEQPDRILFLKYEEMMEDACFYTKKLAEFMGYGFTLEEEKKGMVEKIVEMCSFENLRNLEVNKDGKVGKNGPWEMKNNLFFAKEESETGKIT
ncbi:flavonol 4'-sulfotransferase-like [Hibiscus syriacus]|uniref:flavonol 4'-sulfotransferase-like n=1 Tax=Hibiscus syriacus TaxID=106335 RepID=UPI001920F912|nr:flavonol 4'-sulfotransferase-like [Hibiscus syriacus]